MLKISLNCDLISIKKKSNNQTKKYAIKLTFDISILDWKIAYILSLIPRPTLFLI